MALHLAQHHVDLIQAATSRPPNPGWDDNAACGSLADDSFFPDVGAPDAATLSLCRVCPAWAECLIFGLRLDAEDGEAIGWWGGVSPETRIKLASNLGIRPAVRALTALPEDPARAARVLRDRGGTIAQIAREMQCSERSIYRYLAAPAA